MTTCHKHLILKRSCKDSVNKWTQLHSNKTFFFFKPGQVPAQAHGSQSVDHWLLPLSKDYLFQVELCPLVHFLPFYPDPSDEEPDYRKLIISLFDDLVSLLLEYKFQQGRGAFSLIGTWRRGAPRMCEGARE